jgi:hypothetical protein
MFEMIAALHPAAQVVVVFFGGLAVVCFIIGVLGGLR